MQQTSNQLTADPASNSVQTVPQGRGRVRAFVELCKPRISVMVIMTVFAGGLLSGGGSDLLAVFHAAVGVLLIAASGCAANMYVERYTDFLMFRTSTRPLPAKRLRATEVAVFASVLMGAGCGYMLANCNSLATGLGIATWLLYVLLYTPLKKRSVTNTIVGALPGAMPVLIGAAAVSGPISPLAWLFFAVLVIWQFPHFMAIAWLYRKDYADGKLKMITVTDPSGWWPSVWAVGFASLLLPLGVVPAMLVESLVGAIMIGAAAILLGGWFLRAAVIYGRDIWWAQRNKVAGWEAQSMATSRKLLRVSLLYLPLYMLAIVLGGLM